jgi:hypothetical protein
MRRRIKCLEDTPRCSGQPNFYLYVFSVLEWQDKMILLQCKILCMEYFRISPKYQHPSETVFNKCIAYIFSTFFCFILVLTSYWHDDASSPLHPLLQKYL